MMVARIGQIGGVVEPAAKKCQVVELSDGAVLLNMRSYICVAIAAITGIW
jgi:hypothetical protein